MNFTMAEKFALNQWLSEYPSELSYWDIIELIKSEDEIEDIEDRQITFSETIEYWSAEDVIELIEDTKDSFQWYLNEALKEQTK